MKVALIGDWLGPDGSGGGGVARVVRTLAAGYERLGVEVVILYPRRQGLEATKTPSLIPFGCPRGPQSVLYWSVNAIDLRIKLKQLNPDAVHLHGAAAWGAGIQKNIVFTAHGRLGKAVGARGAIGRMFGPVVDRIEQRAISKFPVVTAQSQQSAAMFFDRDCHVVDNPIYDGFFHQTRPATALCDPIRAVVIGRVSEEKGVLDAIRWFKERARSDWELIIVGQKQASQYYYKCLDAAKQPGPSVRFECPATQDETVSKMAKADVLLLPSHEENSPLVLAESLAVGIPVIANNVGAVESMLAEAPGCLLVGRLADVDQATLLGVVQEDRRDLGLRKARRQLARKFEAHRVANQFLDLLRRAED